MLSILVLAVWTMLAGPLPDLPASPLIYKVDITNPSINYVWNLIPEGVYPHKRFVKKISFGYYDDPKTDVIAWVYGREKPVHIHLEIGSMERLLFDRLYLETTLVHELEHVKQTALDGPISSRTNQVERETAAVLAETEYMIKFYIDAGIPLTSAHDHVVLVSGKVNK